MKRASRVLGTQEDNYLRDTSNTFENKNYNEMKHSWQGKFGTQEDD